ncbi:MAG: sigma-70 family RNA polymerase sigma factor [Planctomycetaceae bacterium]
MKQTEESVWLENIIHRRDGYEATAVDEFADRLLRLARSRLPARIQQRVDPEDIVQSVFKSFFSRHEAGRFRFEQESDVWRLLAAITWKKVQRTIRHHHQQERDVQKEMFVADVSQQKAGEDPTASSLLLMMELLDQILAQLPEKHREILRLRMEDYSIDEIAEKVGVSSRTVDRALAVVRKLASECIEDDTSSEACRDD